jgi:hypothetical protein
MKGSADQAFRDERSDRATTWAFAAGGLTTAAIGFYLGMVDGSAPGAVLLASSGGITAGLLFKRGLAPSRPRRPALRPPRGPFATTDQLRAARLELLAARNGHAQHLKEKSELRQRLLTLRAKMRALGLAAYQPRIETLGHALRTLERQVEVITRLRGGYDRSIAMIDIELESGVAVSELDDEVAATMVAAMHELKELEASQAELARQLEANVEVELLLR